jgi:hypothetical protein
MSHPHPVRRPGTHWATNGRVLGPNVAAHLELRLHPEHDEPVPVTHRRESDPSPGWHLLLGMALFFGALAFCAWFLMP